MRHAAPLVLLHGTETTNVDGFTAEARRLGFDLEPVPIAGLARQADRGFRFVVAAFPRGQSLVLCWVDVSWIATLAGGDDARNRELGDALLHQCLDFLIWPCHPDELAARFDRLFGVGAPGADEDALAIPRGLGLVGRSRPFGAACRLATRLARYDVPVLLEGETGTGKELFARVLHYVGPRRSGPFVPVNCGALPDTLLENELFGHVRGAYTDARGEVEGLVRQAEGGTLFFDEVHALSPKGQVTLLRFVQDQQYRPLGTSTSRRADVRIVAATNRPLADCVAHGAFREDLLYRLDVASIRVPPLRERSEDIPLLVDDFVQRLCSRYQLGTRRLDVSSVGWLSSQPWPGNVRELENFVHRAFLMTDGPLIRIDTAHGMVPADPVDSASGPCPSSFREARARVLHDFEARYVRAVLATTRGNVSEAARQAGKERRVFGRLMKKHGIDRRQFQA